MMSPRLSMCRTAWLLPVLLAGCGDRFVVGMNGRDGGPVVTGVGGRSNDGGMPAAAGIGGASGAGGAIGGRGGSAAGAAGTTASGVAGVGGGTAGTGGNTAAGGRGGSAATGGMGTAGGSAGTGGMRPLPTRVEFLGGRVYPTDDHAETIAVADVNGDGRLDLVVGEYSAPSVAILLNDGDGYRPALRFVVGTTPSAIAVAVGDLDGDSKPDLAVTVAAEARVAVLRNLGDGTFAAPIRLNTRTNPAVVAIGDVNTDGRADLVVGTTQDLGVVFFINDGRGGFAAGGSHFFGETPGALVVADLNADGKQDVVIGGPPNSSSFGAIPFVSILINDGTGTFSESIIRVGDEGGIVALVAGDLDGDGKPDLLTAGDVDVAILRNTGAALPFTSRDLTIAAGPDIAAAGIGDLDGDGRNDVVVASKFTAAVTVLLNRAVNGLDASSFETLDPFFASYAPGAVSLGDVNGDGRTDVAFADEFHAGVLFGRAGGVLSSSQSVSIGDSLTAMTAADLNRDGRLDLIATRGSGAPGDASVFVTMARASGFGATTQYIAGRDTGAVATADVNGDGSVDLIVVEYQAEDQTDPHAMVMMNRGNGTFAAPVLYPVPEGMGAIALADLNGDARSDIVTVNGNDAGDTIAVLINAGNGTFGRAMQFSVGPNPMGVAIADFNADGRLDLATTTVGDGDVLILYNLGNSLLFGTPTRVAAFGATDAGYSLAAHDLDRDGRPDLIVSAYRPARVSVLRNLGGGAFADRVDYSTSWGAGAPIVGDLNADGAPDIAVGGYSGAVDVLLNYGDGTFAPTISYAAGSTLEGLMMGDFTGDGKIDLAAAELFGDARILRNITP